MSRARAASRSPLLRSTICLCIVSSVALASMLWESEDHSSHLPWSESLIMPPTSPTAPLIMSAEASLIASSPICINWGTRGFI